MDKLTTDLLKEKKHYAILDGLRGIAALAIVVFHFMEWIYSDPSKNFIGHGFLAVDFFFCLSGFVIAYAYDNRMATMGVMEFFKSRLIRLHPLVMLGSAIGLIGFLFDPFSNAAEQYSFGQIALIFACSILLIPYPAMEDRFFNLFGLNCPSWSLFWEYIANIIYALVLYRVGRKYLLILIIPAAFGILWISHRAGNLLGGWTGSNFWDGGVRLSYSFLAGMLIFRFNWIIKNRIGFLGLSLLLLAGFMFPHDQYNWLTEALVVLLYFPLLVSLGAGTTISNKWEKVCHFSGKISYPLYMTHYAGIWIFGNYFTRYKPGMNTLTPIIIISTILLVCLAYIVMVAYDTPVRRYLTKKRQERLKRNAQ